MRGAWRRLADERARDQLACNENNPQRLLFSIPGYVHRDLIPSRFFSLEVACYDDGSTMLCQDSPNEGMLPEITCQSGMSEAIDRLLARQACVSCALAPSFSMASELLHAKNDERSDWRSAAGSGRHRGCCSSG